MEKYINKVKARLKNLHFNEDEQQFIITLAKEAFITGQLNALKK